MTEPILTSEEVSTIIAATKEKWNAEADSYNQWSDLGSDEHYELIGAAIEAAVLEKVCGKPIYQTRWENPATIWGDVLKDAYDDYQSYGYADRRIVYALTRSKP